MSVEKTYALPNGSAKTGLYSVAVNKCPNMVPALIAGSVPHYKIIGFSNERLEQVPSFYQV